MKTQLPLVQAIGFCLIYVALGFLFPAFTISPNPFEAAPFWIITSALAVLLIGLVFGLLTGRFTPQFKPTRLQWLGFGVLSLVLFLEGYLLSPLQIALARSLPNSLGHRPRLWDAQRSNRSPNSS